MNPRLCGHHVYSTRAPNSFATSVANYAKAFGMPPLVWKIEGRDLNGQYVFMRIDPRTGQIVRMDRGWW